MKKLVEFAEKLDRRMKEEERDQLADQLVLWTRLKEMLAERFPHITCHFEDGRRGCAIFLMYEGGVGFVRVSWYTGEDTGYLSDLSVNEDQRHNGIGLQLMKAAEECARIRGLQYMRLQVLRFSWMHRWYSDRGYQTIKNEYDVATEVGVYRYLEKQL